jgi:hypothetical protein
MKMPLSLMISIIYSSFHGSPDSRRRQEETATQDEPNLLPKKTKTNRRLSDGEWKNLVILHPSYSATISDRWKFSGLQISACDK